MDIEGPRVVEVVQVEVGDAEPLEHIWAREADERPAGLANGRLEPHDLGERQRLGRRHRLDPAVDATRERLAVDEHELAVEGITAAETEIALVLNRRRQERTVEEPGSKRVDEGELNNGLAGP